MGPDVWGNVGGGLKYELDAIANKDIQYLK
jgi:hypothetical protein